MRLSLAPPQRGGRQPEPGRGAGCCSTGYLTIWQCLMLDVEPGLVGDILSERRCFSSSLLPILVWTTCSSSCYLKVHLSLLSLHLRIILLHFLTFHLFLLPPELIPVRLWVNAGLSCPHVSSHPPSFPSPKTLSITASCLMQWRRMVSITCNKKDGAEIRPHMKPGRCQFPAEPQSHPMNPEPLGPHPALPAIASLAGTASERELRARGGTFSKLLNTYETGWTKQPGPPSCIGCGPRSACSFRGNPTKSTAKSCKLCHFSFYLCFCLVVTQSWANHKICKTNETDCDDLRTLFDICSIKTLQKPIYLSYFNYNTVTDNGGNSHLADLPKVTHIGESSQD